MRRRFFALVLAFVLSSSVWTVVVGATVVWDSYEIGPMYNPLDVRMGFIDGDGNPDVVASSSSHSQVAWFQNPGDPKGPWTKHDILNKTNGHMTCMAVGDINGNGSTDVVIGSQVYLEGQNMRVLWMENWDPTGNWPVHVVDTDPNVFPKGVAVVDLDGDPSGTLDIVAVGQYQYDGGFVYWYENQGLNTWTRRTIYSSSTTGEGRSVAIGYINDDGRPDIVVSEYDRGLGETRYLYWYETPLDPKTQQFTKHQIWDIGGGGWVGLRVLDMDSDYDEDIVAGLYDKGELRWFENDGSGGFASNYLVDSSLNYASGVDAGDVDIDGDFDIVAGSSSGLYLYTAPNNDIKSPVEWNSEDIDTSAYLKRGVAVVELDSDSDLEVVAGGNPIKWYNRTLNQKPEVDFTWSPPEPDEGELIQFTDLSSDPDGTIVTWHWDFGNGVESDLQHPTQKYGHAGSYPVTLNVTDDDGASNETTKFVDVSNVPPTVYDINVTAQEVLEGENITFWSYFDDPSWLDNHTALWDFDDGWTREGDFHPGWGETYHELNTTYAYGHCGEYNVTLNVTDDLGDSDSSWILINVTNVDPTVYMRSDTSHTSEGENVTFYGYFDDPSWNDTHDAIWDFGDGHTRPGTFYPGKGYKNTHHDMNSTTYAYGHAGTYKAYLNVTDDCCGNGSYNVTIVVDNVDPTVYAWASAYEIPEGQNATFDGYFDDPSWNDTHDAIWDFGDGWTRPGTFYPGKGYKNTHHDMNSTTYAYGHAGIYKAYLNVTDDANGSGSSFTTITVANVDPTVVSWASAYEVPEGQNVTFDGYFDDPSWNDTHDAIWDFGDGWTRPGTFYPGKGYKNTHHDMNSTTYAYGHAGTYQACLNVTDDLEGEGSYCFNITVLNVAPTVWIWTNLTNDTVNEGTPFMVHGYFYDPSWNDTHNATWDFQYNSRVEGGPHIQNGAFSPGPGYGNTTHYMDSVEYVYGDNHNYTICLNVTDDFNAAGSACVVVHVLNVPPDVSELESILHKNAPRTHGYWKHQCKVNNPKPDHPGIQQEWIDAIAAQSDVFWYVEEKKDVCDVLDPKGQQTPMDRALKQLMALWLNVIADTGNGVLLWIDSPLHHPDAPDNDTVREFIEHAEYLILSDPTSENLQWVEHIAVDINEDADGGNDYQFIDPTVGEFIAHTDDPGSDDLTFEWVVVEPPRPGEIHTVLNDPAGVPEPPYPPYPSPWGIYPFHVDDTIVIGFDERDRTYTVCLNEYRDDDGGVGNGDSPQCVSGPLGGKKIVEGRSSGTSIEWSFIFSISYRTIEEGFVIAEVAVAYTASDQRVNPTQTGGTL